MSVTELWMWYRKWWSVESFVILFCYNRYAVYKDVVHTTNLAYQNLYNGHGNLKDYKCIQDEIDKWWRKYGLAYIPKNGLNNKQMDSQVRDWFS